MLLYVLLHLTGYGLSLDDLRAFRQWGSRTPGHPETLLTPGVDATTGPLGERRRAGPAGRLRPRGRGGRMTSAFAKSFFM